MEGLETFKPVETTSLDTGFDFAEDAESFADLLDAYDYSMPRRGQLLDGVILEVDENEVIVDVGLKRDAFIPREDLDRLNDDVVAALQPGQDITVYVLRPTNQEGNLLVSLNKALQQTDWFEAEELMEANEVVQVTVVGFNKGGLLADFGRIRGFIPQSHVVDIPRGVSSEQLREIKADMIGNTLDTKVVEVNRERNRLILSERDARSAVKRARLAELEIGSVVKGQVVGLVDFGAFVDIGGVDGLVHISNLDRRYVSHPSDVLKVGDEVEVRIDEVDLNKERISLNRAALMPDPWDEIEEHYQIGSLVTGTVTNAADFGIFVALPGHFEGLVHVSEMSEYGVTDPGQMVSEGEELLVRIIDIDRAQQRISLSLNAVSADEQEAWMHERMLAAQPEEPAYEEQDSVADQA